MLLKAHRVGTLWFAALLLAAPWARAGGEVSGGVGPALAINSAQGFVFPGFGAQARGAWSFHDQHAVGLAITFYNVYRTGLPQGSVIASHNAYQAMALYRFSPGDPDSLHPFFEASLGAGIWDGCVLGDLCGGAGLAFSGGGGVRLPLRDHFAIDAGLGANVQTGLVNGAEMMIIPTLWLGGVASF